MLGLDPGIHDKRGGRKAAPFHEEHTMDIEADGRKLSNLATINVLLGKNGSGKSTFLRTFDQRKRDLPNFGTARYITPERGGELSYQGQIETNLVQDPTWGDNMRRANRFDNFRQTSVTEFRRLETLVLRKIESDAATRRDMTFSFDSVMASINELLDHVEIVRGASAGFEIRTKATTQVRGPSTLSSGESELVSLAIEILAFVYSAETYPGKTSYLFLDEPDVHLHPDLQERLIGLLVAATTGKEIVVILATHSTAILGALSNNSEARVGFVTSAQMNVDFVAINETLQRILPIFGAHPLSNVFNKTPILLVEGEDDERIWQQAARTSQGKVCVWPCNVGEIQSLNQYEDQVEAVASAIYENAVAFSLRDRDESPYEIDDKTIVKRMRLFCRAAENLLLSDDVLVSLGTDWTKMMTAMDYWLLKYPEHPQHEAMNAFKSGGFDRLGSDVKALRNIFMMLAGSNKPWEVAVGQAIAGLVSGNASNSDHSLTTYLGPKLVDALNLSRRSRFSFLKKSRYM
jgi:energy-coupling factor transporter ATP-binding protein EcfA2